MRTTKDILAAYAGCKFSPAGWLRVLADDARLLRAQGLHHEARLLDKLAAPFKDAAQNHLRRT